MLSTRSCADDRTAPADSSCAARTRVYTYTYTHTHTHTYICIYSCAARTKPEYGCSALGPPSPVSAGLRFSAGGPRPSVARAPCAPPHGAVGSAAARSAVPDQLRVRAPARLLAHVRVVPCVARRVQPLRCAVPCNRRAREPHGRAWPAGSRRTARAEAQVPCHLCETALRPKALRSHLRACAAKWCAPPTCSRCPPHRAAADLFPVVFSDPFSIVLSTLGVGRLPCRTFRLRCAQSARLRRSCPQWPIRCTERMGLSSRQVAVGARDRCRRRVRHAVLAGTCLRRLQPCARERAARPDLFGCALTRLCPDPAVR